MLSAERVLLCKKYGWLFATAKQAILKQQALVISHDAAGHFRILVLLWSEEGWSGL